MGLSTQRLMILVLAINLMISVAYGIYENPTLFDESAVSGMVDVGNRLSTDISGESTSIQPENLQVEGSFGNAIRMGTTLFKLFIRGMNPFPFNEDTYTDPLDIIIAWGLMIFRVFIYVLISIELYMILKNRKAT